MSATNYQEASLNKDYVAMMQHPDWWPNRPFLPLRNRSREKDQSDIMNACLGYIIECQDKCQFTVFKGIWFLHNPTRPVEVYASFRSMVDDGWEVD